MRRVIKLFIFTTLLLSLATFAESEATREIKPNVAVNMSKVETLDNHERLFIRKSAFEALLASGSFNISMGDFEQISKTDERLYYIDIKIHSIRKGFYKIELSMLERSEKELINYVEEAPIPRFKVQYRARVLLYKLIFGSNFDEVNEELIKKETIPLGIKPNFKSKSSIKNRKKEKNKKNKLKIEKIQDLNDEISSIEEEIEEENNLKPYSSKKKKKKIVKIQKFESPDLNLTKAKKEFKDPVSKLTWLKKFNYAIGEEFEAVETVVNVNNEVDLGVSTAVKRMFLRFHTNMKIKEWGQHLSSGFVLSKLVGEDKYEVPVRNSLFTTYNVNAHDEKLFGTAGIEYESNGFVGISLRGGGLQAFSNKVLWMGAGLRFHEIYYDRPFTASIEFKKTFFGTTNFSNSSEDSTPLDGNKIHLNIRGSVYKNLGVGLSYESIDLVSASDNSLSNKFSTYGFMVTYN